MKSQTFRAVTEPRARGGIAIRVPFDPNVVWSTKDRHYVSGSIEGYGFRGSLTTVGEAWYLQLGPTWCRDPRVGPGADVSVVLMPEGPQFESLGADFQAALAREPEARRFFVSLATFYRNGYVSWIDQARRPETRARRIDEAVQALKAGRRERS